MAVTFYIPSGPANMAAMFPDVNFNQVDEYFLQVIDTDDSAENPGVLATTNHFNRACCCGDDTIQVFYVNYLGKIDMIIMKTDTTQTITASEQWKKSNSYPLCKFDGGFQRFNVISNDTLTAENSCFQEEDQNYLKELLASPNAWMKLKGAQGQDDDYIPITIADGTFITRNPIGQRYQYVLQIVFVLGNDKIILRN